MTRTIIVLLAAAATLGGCAGTAPDVRAVWHGAEKSAGVTPEEMRARGVEHFRAGRYGMAINAFQAAIDAGEAGVETLNGLGASYDRIGRHDLAERAYRRALKLEPQSAQTLNNIGFSYLMRGRVDVAAAFLMDAEAQAPDSLAVAVNLQAAQDALQGETERKTARAEPAAAPVADKVAMPLMRIERRTPSVQHLVTYRDQGRAAVIRIGVQPAEERAVSVAALPPPPQAPRLPAAPEKPVAARSSGAPVIEISNGAGRNGLAARTRDWLRAEGIAVQRLTNADHFNHHETTIYFRAPWQELAARLADLMPVGVTLRQQDDLRSGIRLELGADFLRHDDGQTVITKEKSNAISG
ncbi:MAG: tetratricopeptide repeat protein [Alphaproteobacteria bacterium]|nr:tetratricopeptide repeat protein [Alphaproteobacteria bacterium]